MENINHLAVFVCALASLLIGGLWYSPVLFAKVWQRETGLTDDQLKTSNPAKIFGLSFLLAYLVSYNLAFFLAGTDTNWRWGIGAGLLASVWAIAMHIMMGLFEQRTFKHMLINCSYMAVYFAVIGFILGIWR